MTGKGNKTVRIVQFVCSIYASTIANPSGNFAFRIAPCSILRPTYINPVRNSVLYGASIFGYQLCRSSLHVYWKSQSFPTVEISLKTNVLCKTNRLR